MLNSSTKTCRQGEIDKIVTGPGGMDMPSGVIQGDQGRIQAERELQDLRHMPLVGSAGRVFWGLLLT